MDFGQYLKHLRKQKGLSQERLGDASGLSGATISVIENGHRYDFKVSSLLGLSKALGVDPMKLFIAYQGKDPDVVTPPEDKARLEIATQQFLKALPFEQFIKAFASDEEMLLAFEEIQKQKKKG